MITFWDLTVPERRCLGLLYMDEPFNNLPGVGMKSVERLIGLGLIEESPDTPYGADTHYRRTEDGEKVYEEMYEANKIPR